MNKTREKKKQEIGIQKAAARPGRVGNAISSG